MLFEILLPININISILIIYNFFLILKYFAFLHWVYSAYPSFLIHHQLCEFNMHKMVVFGTEYACSSWADFFSPLISSLVNKQGFFSVDSR